MTSYYHIQSEYINEIHVITLQFQFTVYIPITVNINFHEYSKSSNFILYNSGKKTGPTE